MNLDLSGVRSAVAKSFRRNQSLQRAAAPSQPVEEPVAAEGTSDLPAEILPNATWRFPNGDLAGGFKIGETVYYGSAGQMLPMHPDRAGGIMSPRSPAAGTSEGGEERLPRVDRVEYGMKGKIFGEHKTILLYDVQFEEINGRIVPCPPSILLRSKPPEELAGGYRVGETVYWAGKEKKTAFGEHVQYGQRGEVMGGHWDDREGVAVKFEGNANNIYCLPSQLSSTSSEISRESGRRYSASL